MIISDKQELKRCVKQAVRRAYTEECCLNFDLQDGRLGVDALLDESGLRGRKGTPFGGDGAAFYAALDALELPSRDLNSARSIQLSYERNAYLREILDAMRARRVLVSVDAGQRAVDFFGDERFAPLVTVSGSLFAPGRYGVDYQQAARLVQESLNALDARDLMPESFDEDALRYCLMPVCEDTGCVIHIRLTCEDEIHRFSGLLDSFPSVRALVRAPQPLEPALIACAGCRPRMLVCLTGFEHLALALSSLGTRLMAYASCASSPDMMLGRWLCAKEQFWQALCDVYLPLARAGYSLESSAVEQDVEMLLGGSMMNLYT